MTEQLNIDDLLEQGPEVWNNWRKEHPEIIPDLRSADLGAINLRGALLGGACLRRANLYGAAFYLHLDAQEKAVA